MLMRGLGRRYLLPTDVEFGGDVNFPACPSSSDQDQGEVQIWEI